MLFASTSEGRYEVSRREGLDKMERVAGQSDLAAIWLKVSPGYCTRQACAVGNLR